MKIDENKILVLVDALSAQLQKEIDSENYDGVDVYTKALQRILSVAGGA